MVYGEISDQRLLPLRDPEVTRLKVDKASTTFTYDTRCDTQWKPHLKAT
jgi:hypothetical protein